MHGRESELKMQLDRGERRLRWTEQCVLAESDGQGRVQQSGACADSAPNTLPSYTIDLVLSIDRMTKMKNSSFLIGSP